jgi:hypothetical protein
MDEETERWADIPEFRAYRVSDWGRVYSITRDTLMELSRVTGGAVRVNLRRDGASHSQSVKVLVADAFVDRSFDSDTPICLDGDQTNLHYLNLAWRPRWYAWKYMRQFHEEPRIEIRQARVENVHTGVVYENSIEAGLDDGVLWDDVIRSAISGRAVYPTGCIYRLADMEWDLGVV